MSPLTQIRQALRAVSVPGDAIFLQGFFKTGPGQYAEGDRFLGVRVPATRRLIASTAELSEAEVMELLHSGWHEERLLALFALVRRFERGDEPARQHIWQVYLENTRWINNWDLVDTSAPPILGEWVAAHPKDAATLKRLGRSSDLWERRMAILATFTLIRRQEFGLTLELATGFLADKHDLIHKASGWMLREIGNRDAGVLRDFLKIYAATMPRTMLRYAIEKRPPEERRHWLGQRDLSLHPC